MGERDDLSRHLESMAPHRAILRAVECQFMRKIPFDRPVLDIGSGDGHFASMAYSQPIDVGMDVSAKDTREAASRPNVYRALVLASGPTLPFRDAAFGTVLSNCVLEHIPDIDGALREIARVLRPGGGFAATLPSEHYPDFLLGSTVARRLGLKGLSEGYGRFFNRISYHYHVYPPAVWDQKLEAVGLTVKEHRYYFSARAHRAFDLSHYLSVPNLVAKKCFGRWVVHPVQAVPYAWWLRRYFEEPLPAVGAYQFVRCERMS